MLDGRSCAHTAHGTQAGDGAGYDALVQHPDRSLIQREPGACAVRACVRTRLPVFC